MSRRSLALIFSLLAVFGLLAACSSSDDDASENNGEEVPGEVSTTKPGDTVSVPNTSTPQPDQKIQQDNLSDNAICNAATSPALEDATGSQFASAVSTFGVVVQTYEANMSKDGLAALQPYKTATTNDAKATGIASFNDWCAGDG
jgi:hypothetical protein